ncbi:MAG: hypothetical protein DRP22_03730 [Verrucomicrobia bacterium]|nr:MAG: hypothetical protein DRP22_03730 [Verrucomicrobiota bacterium]
MRVAVLGLGLMGASLAWALRRRGVGPVAGYARRPETRQLALERGICDTVADDPEVVVADCELAVICTPVMVVPDILQRVLGKEKSRGLLVTDVSSTKTWVVERCEKICGSGKTRFLGSHPLCGSERSGLENADPDLYEDAVTVVTPTPQSTESDVELLTRFWGLVGSRVLRMPARTHDAVVARTSHLPHALAALMVHIVGRGDIERDRKLCGTGFRDASRIASGPPIVWRDIFLTNAQEMAKGLDFAIDELKRLRGMIASGQGEAVEVWLREAAELREKILRLTGKRVG